jgi:NADPH-dependent ferric siderophore reductase
MAETSPTFERVTYELKPRPVTVKTIQDITPRYRRIVFAGDALSDFQSASPADHIKFQIETNGEPVRRDYTPRAFGNAELTIDFALHADGPVTAWAREASIGSAATILGPRGSKIVHPVFDAYLLIGDETMLPAIGRALEMLPAESPVLAVIEVDDPDDEIELATATDAEIIWAHRIGRAPGVAMVGALATADWPEGDVFCWAGGEASAMRDVRRHLLFERQLPRENLSMSGHWKAGESNFDHHSPIED